MKKRKQREDDEDGGVDASKGKCLRSTGVVVLPSERHTDLRKWLEKRGAEGLSTLKLSSSTDHGGGRCLRTKKALKTGDTILVIPQSCILSCKKLAQTSFCQRAAACIRNAGEIATDEFLMLLSMAAGRTCESHEFHVYLSSLPETSDNLPFLWPRKIVERLIDTNLFSSLCKYRDIVDKKYASLVGIIRTAHPDLLPKSFKNEDVRWAHAHYMSRRFPAHLCCDLSLSLRPDGETTPAASGSKLHGSVGVMIPFLDLMNHNQSTHIDWRGTAKGVEFRCGNESISAGHEVFMNYSGNAGGKGNDVLMLIYGFSYFGNQYDAYSLKLSARVPESENNEKSDPTEETSTRNVEIGTFRLLRSDHPDVRRGLVAQIPSSIWRAMSDPLTFATKRRAAEERERRRDTEDAEEEEDAPPHVEWEDVNALLHTIKHRLGPFLRTQKRDQSMASGETKTPADPRERFVAIYRNGQREILEEVANILGEMIGE
eukprot:g1481.t1